MRGVITNQVTTEAYLAIFKGEEAIVFQYLNVEDSLWTSHPLFYDIKSSLIKTIANMRFFILTF